MKVLDPGHRYYLQQLDGVSAHTIIQFVKRCEPQETYPGNCDSSPGTIMQEVLRALIDRVRYVNNQQSWFENRVVLFLLHLSIWLLEFRAHRHRGSVLLTFPWKVASTVTCRRCGHVACTKHQGE